jgi:prepilin-type N-terminal cleavage/methylation domain-containing protein
MNKVHRNGRAAFTIVELSVAMLILAILLGAIGMTVMRGGGAFKQGIAAGAVEAQARRAIDRIAEQFASAQASNLNPNPLPPFGSNTLDFRNSTGFAAGAPTWGATTRLQFQYDPGELDDGVDNDGDGIADEGRVVLMENFGLPNQVTQVLCLHVREFLEGETANGADQNGNGLIDERGLSFELVGQTLTIRLSLERLDADNNRLVRTVETGVRLRN